jgi:DMSO/TMAO reductase YedYZ molybdopterin-dependent catalytic subunit
MNEVAATSGIGWCNAISTAQWRGARLRDVLIAAGVDEDSVYSTTSTTSGVDAALHESKRVKHVHFIGADGMQASIPIKKALSRDGDVLLAYGR